MYNGFKYRKEQAELKAEKERVKPLKLRNPALAKQKLNVLSNKAAMRREEFIMKCDMEEDTFKRKYHMFLTYLFNNIVLHNGGNDSMAYKTSFYDFRGEKGRDKNLDISPKRFNATTFMTTKERVELAERKAKEGLFQERNHHKEELANQELRAKPKIATSPLGMAFSPASEMHRVQEKLKSNRRFEPEFFNANRLVQPDLFRIEKRHTSH